MDNTPSGVPTLSFRDRYRLQAMQREWDFQRKMTDLMEKSPAYKDFYGAAVEARKSVVDDDLIPKPNERFEDEYSIRQGLKAACLTREDIEAAKRVQLRLLERLDRVHSFQVGTIERLDFVLQTQITLKRLAWICMGLLVYIALRLS